MHQRQQHRHFRRRPDIALSSHRTDDFGMFDAGVFMLLDGANGSVLYTYHHPEPQPASLFAFSNYNQPAFGDLGQSTAPDIYQAAMRQNNPYTGRRQGYVMNGAFKQGGSPNSISFSTIVDPTPHPSRGLRHLLGRDRDVFGDSRNELLIGAYGPHNPGTNLDVINDVHIFDPIHEGPPADDSSAGSAAWSRLRTSLAPLGDLNEDGFLDFAVGAGLFDGTATGGGCSSARRSVRTPGACTSSAAQHGVATGTRYDACRRPAGRGSVSTQARTR